MSTGDSSQETTVIEIPEEVGQESVKERETPRAASLFGRLGFYTILSTVFLVPLTFSTRAFDIIELPKQVLLGFFVALSIFFWLIRAVLVSEFKFKRSGLNIAVLVFFVSSAISTIGSISPTISFLGFYSRGNDSFLVNILLTLFFFVAVNSLETKNDVRKMDSIVTPAPLTTYPYTQTCFKNSFNLHASYFL